MVFIGFRSPLFTPKLPYHTPDETKNKVICKNMQNTHPIIIMFPSIRAHIQPNHHPSPSSSRRTASSSSTSRRQRMTIEEATRLSRSSATAMMMMPAASMSYMHTTVVVADVANDLPDRLDEATAATMETSPAVAAAPPSRTGRNPFRGRHHSHQLPHQRYHHNRQHRKIQWQFNSQMNKERGTFA